MQELYESLGKELKEKETIKKKKNNLERKKIVPLIEYWKK